MYNVRLGSSSRHDRLRRILFAAVRAYLEGAHQYPSVGRGSDELGDRGSQRRHIILRGGVIPIDRFHYRTLFPYYNPFYAPMTPFHNTITRGDVRTTEMRSNPHSLRKSRKTLLRNALSLSTRISAGAPRSQNRLSRWLTTLAAYCRLRRRQIENREAPQSMSDR